MAQPAHTQLLTAAARRILRPIGMSQRGRSRIWLADQGWWLILVEFQPSAWSKGSFLNVGVMWLWFEKEYLSYDEGGRVERFGEFQSESQFAPFAENLSLLAAEEVNRYRTLFPSLESITQYLATKSQKGLWDMFNAGVACGLIGDVTQAKQFFDQVVSTDIQTDWARTAATIAQDYVSAVEDLTGFRNRIERVILRTRHRLRLETIADIGLR